MTSNNFVVVYDANILYSAFLRDLMMRLALTNMYRAKWTDRINDEWSRNLLSNRPDLDPQKISGVVDLMNNAVQDCIVGDYEKIEDIVELPDKNDHHVLAAAIKCGAQVIVTFNIKDFPKLELEKYSIEVKHPDDFVLDLIDLDLAKVLAAIRDQRAALKNNQPTPEEFVDHMMKCGLTNSASKIKDYADYFMI